MAQREGKTPNALASEPDLIPAALPYFTAFKLLHGSRPYAPDGSPMPVPISDLYAYCMMFQISDLQDRFDLIRYMQVCDNTFISECKRRGPKQHGKSGKHPKTRR